MADTNLVNIQGSYSGALSSRGAVLLGEDNGLDGSNPIPVVVTGKGTSAGSGAPFSFVAGKFAKANASCSFVFNGSDESDASNPYIGAGRDGTASFNTKGGLDGFYVGDKSLTTHMDELTGYVKTTLTSDSLDNNLLHRSGSEVATGVKTFASSVVVSSTSDASEKTVLDGSSISIYSSDKGGLQFHFGGVAEITSTLKESESGKISVGAELDVQGDSTFKSGNNVFGGITLSSDATASLSGGNVLVKTMPIDAASQGDSNAASTEYVHIAIQQRLSEGGIASMNSTYTGENTFANNVTLSSHRYDTENDPVEVDFTPGITYVSTPSGNYSSLQAANMQGVKRLISSLCGGTAAVGSSVVPIYFNGSSLVKSASDAGSSIQPIYLKGGSLSALTGTVGGVNRPVYLSNGVLTQCNSIVDSTNEQNIAGQKTFTDKVWVSSCVTVFSKAQRGTTALANTMRSIDFTASLNKSASYETNGLGRLSNTVTSNGIVSTAIEAVQNSASTVSNPVKASIGVGVNAAGKPYTFAPTPLNSATNSNEIVNQEWAFRYLAKNDTPNIYHAINILPDELISNGFLRLESSLTVNSSQNQSYIIPPKNNIKNLHFGRPGVDNIALGSSTNPIYIDSEGVLTASTGTVGHIRAPIYLENGEFKECDGMVNQSRKQIITGKKIFQYNDDSSGIDIRNPYSSFNNTNTSSSTWLEFTGSDAQPLAYLTESSDGINGRESIFLTVRNTGNLGVEDIKKWPKMGLIVSRRDSSDVKTFAPTPTDIGNDKDSRIATVGWCNTYFATKSSKETETYNPPSGSDSRYWLSTRIKATGNDSSSLAYVHGRDTAALAQIGKKNFYNDSGRYWPYYLPMLSVKGYADTWEVGTYGSTSVINPDFTQLDHLQFSCIRDADYNSNENRVNTFVQFTNNGSVRYPNEAPLGCIILRPPISPYLSVTKNKSGYVTNVTMKYYAIVDTIRIGDIPYRGGNPKYYIIKVISLGTSNYIYINGERFLIQSGSPKEIVEDYDANKNYQFQFEADDSSIIVVIMIV